MLFTFDNITINMNYTKHGCNYCITCKQKDVENCIFLLKHVCRTIDMVCVVRTVNILIMSSETSQLYINSLNCT